MVPISTEDADLISNHFYGALHAKILESTCSDAVFNLEELPPLPANLMSAIAATSPLILASKTNTETTKHEKAEMEVASVGNLSR